jgi:hypothetical protein
MYAMIQEYLLGTTNRNLSRCMQVGVEVRQQFQGFIAGLRPVRTVPVRVSGVMCEKLDNDRIIQMSKSLQKHWQAPS